MIERGPSENRLFVLDTNVLMHDPTALFKFAEHDVFLPMTVLEELDGGKKGSSEIARNVRQTTRFLDEILEGADFSAIDTGLDIPSALTTAPGETPVSGKLYFQTRLSPAPLPDSLPGGKADNDILAVTLSLSREHPNVTLVSKDINLRVKAAVLGLHSEDYFNDRVLDDVDLLYTGRTALPDDFWQRYGEDMESWHDAGSNYYRIHGDITREWMPNEFVHLDDPDRPFAARVMESANDSAVLRYLDDYLDERHKVWGINARNQEQNYALNLLMDPDVDFVSLTGMAGTGKTLLALAAGLQQTLDESIYSEIILTREAVPVGEDIGFLPGTEEEKMTPWMGALMDNLEVLTGNQKSGGDAGSRGTWARDATQDLVQHRIKIRSVNFMRGRTFNARYIIIDEAQNLTAKQLKTLITRAGPGSKIICLGNLGQIDTPYLSETTSGLTNVVDRFKRWEGSGHITLLRGERSRLADYANEVL
ncbi:MAG: PhoH family protein [Gammaproteobacteria bacterium]